MNIYRTEFFAFCPVNSVRVKYALRIETKEVIKVEQIIDEVTLHSDGYHEEIADDLFRAFGGRQTLLADHHGVTIETVRGAADCAWCNGSGMADATGKGDLERCDRCSAATAHAEPDPSEVEGLRSMGLSRQAAERMASTPENITAGAHGVKGTSE